VVVQYDWFAGWEAVGVGWHVAFACKALVAMNGEDVARWGGELHGQMRCGNNSAKNVE